jgi:pseudaminic acid cytidylyltransferase
MSSADVMPCLIPARGGSKRFPRKNVAALRGRPLLAYAIDAARASGVFGDVWVSTDDGEIAEVAVRHGAKVHERPAALAAADATLVQVALDFADWLAGRGESATHLGIVLPTAALLRGGDIRQAWAKLSGGDADFAMAVTTYMESPFQALEEVDGHLRLIFGAAYARRSQLLPSVVVDSGYFYLVRVEALRRERTLYGAKLVGQPIPRERSIDIDEPAQMVIAEALLAAAEARA